MYRIALNHDIDVCQMKMYTLCCQIHTCQVLLISPYSEEVCNLYVPRLKLKIVKISPFF